MSRLVMDGVGVSFGGLSALTNVNLEIGNSSVLGLIGPNGAGKSTCINVLTGFQPPSSGTVALDDAELIGKDPADFRRLGISRTFQAGRLFSSLTVQDNVVAAAVGMGFRRCDAIDEAKRLILLVGLTNVETRNAGDLPYTDQRRLAIARALVGNPKFLLLDEPAAGMSAVEARCLGELILEIAAAGVRVLLIEHNVPLVLSVCEQIVVLDGGRVIARGNPQEIRANVAVRSAYLGTTHSVEVKV